MASGCAGMKLFLYFNQWLMSCKGRGAAQDLAKIIKKCRGWSRRQMANYTETEKEQSFRGNDYTGIKENKPFGGSVHGSCGVVLTNKFVKMGQAHIMV